MASKGPRPRSLVATSVPPFGATIWIAGFNGVVIPMVAKLQKVQEWHFEKESASESTESTKKVLQKVLQKVQSKCL